MPLALLSSPPSSTASTQRCQDRKGSVIEWRVHARTVFCIPQRVLPSMLLCPPTSSSTTDLPLSRQDSAALCRHSRRLAWSKLPAISREPSTAHLPTGAASPLHSCAHHLQPAIPLQVACTQQEHRGSQRSFICPAVDAGHAYLLAGRRYVAEEEQGPREGRGTVGRSPAASVAGASRVRARRADADADADTGRPPQLVIWDTGPPSADAVA